MVIMPMDNVMVGPTISGSYTVMAQMLAEDWNKSDADVKALTQEAEDLLNAVDAAISQSEIKDDSEWEQMRRCWCFIGPGMCRQIERLKILTAKPRFLNKPEIYSMLGLIHTFLTVRRQTLELNDIEVLKAA